MLGYFLCLSSFMKLSPDEWVNSINPMWAHKCTVQIFLTVYECRLWKTILLTRIFFYCSKHEQLLCETRVRNSNDGLVFIYRPCELVNNKCDLVHSFGILAGKILHWSYGKIDIMCRNFHINPRVMEVKAGQVLRCAPFIKSKVDKK